MKKTKTLLGAVLACVLALALLTACDGWDWSGYGAYKDKLAAAIQTAYSSATVKVDRTSALNSQADTLLKNLDGGKTEIAYQTDAVMVDCSSTDETDSAAVKATAEAVKSAIDAKNSGIKNCTLNIGIAVGDVKGNRKVVVCFQKG